MDDQINEMSEEEKVVEQQEEVQQEQAQEEQEEVQQESTEIKREDIVFEDPQTDEVYSGNQKPKKQKKQLTPEQKKKKRVKGLIIATAVILVIAIFFSACAIVNTVGVTALLKQGSNYEQVAYGAGEQLTPHKDGDGYWYFDTHGEDFKIMQFTDVHIGGGCFSQSKDAWALNAVATMIRQEKPDLVIVTGDIAYPVPFQAGTFNNLNATKIFANMMEKLGVYWTFVFGNHDTEAYSMYTRSDICDFYENSNFKYCLFERGFADEEKGYGNNIIKVKNGELTTQAIVLYDSHSYVDGDAFGMLWKYDNLHQSQVDWYAAEIDKINAANKLVDPSYPAVKSMAYFHIPLVEYRDAWAQVIEKNNSQVAGTNTKTVISDDVTYIYGNMGEKDKQKNGVRTYGVFCGCHEDNFFETGLEKGLQAIFCGHDHYNNFSIEYKGIRLTYGMSIDYLAYSGIYKEHSQRGTTIITTSADGKFTATPKNYYKDYNVAAEKGSLSDID